MSAAGKAWSEMLVMRDLEDMMGSTTGSIAEEVVSRGSESFSVPIASTSTTTSENVEDEKQEKSNQDIFESTRDLGNVENFGVTENFQNRTLKRKRVRAVRAGSQYSSTSSINFQNTGGYNKNSNSNKRMRHNQEGNANLSPRSSSSGRIPANKYVPKVLLSSDYNQDAFFNATFPADATVEQSITFIAKTLGEQKPEIIAKVVEYVGVEKAVALFNECRQVEKNGGMLVNFGHRRRTPGGVFLQLFKTDKEVSEDAKNALLNFTKELFRSNSKAGRQKPSLPSKEKEHIKEEPSLTKKEEQTTQSRDEDINEEKELQ